MQGAVGLKGLLFLMTLLNVLTASLFVPSHISERWPKALGPVSELLVVVPTTSPWSINLAVINIASLISVVIVLKFFEIIFLANLLWLLELKNEGNKLGFGNLIIGFVSFFRYE